MCLFRGFVRTPRGSATEDAATVDPQLLAAEVIGEDEDDIGFLVGCQGVLLGV
jgi:hypothetical protein